MLFGNWLTESLFPFLLALLPLVLWLAFWLFAVNWQKVWPTLREGAWAPLVLLGLIVAVAWSKVVPVRAFGLPNFFWQLLSVGGAIGAALFAGWLQGLLGYTPIEVSVEPPAHHDHGHGDHHGHSHGHEEKHAPAHQTHGHH